MYTFVHEFRYYLYETDTITPQHWLDFRQAGRELVRVDAAGNVTIADDITLDEAKFVITKLAKAVSDDTRID